MTPQRPPPQTPPEQPSAKPSGLSRREAILLSLGQADQVALERDRQAAIEGALGPTARAPDALEEPAAPPPAPPRGLSRLLPEFIRRRLARQR